MAKFLGSSIVSVNESASWGGELSCDISLVDCEIEGDSFSPPEIGTPVRFVYESHEFFGILDRYTINGSASGNPTYTAYISNGIFLLQGTKLILNNYYGQSNFVPNLVNIFGYLENNLGFGGSEVNSAGISWSKINSAVNTLINNSTGTIYGGCIRHKTFKYGIDLTALPAIPNYYRINSDSVSLLEFIEEICQAGGCDFFIKMEYLTPEEQQSTGLTAKFKLYTISRVNEPESGKIQEFIDSANCVSQKELGQEIRKDPTSKLVLGANVEQLWLVEPESSGSISGGITQEEYTGYTTLPYFGLDEDGNYIVGETPEDDEEEYYFDIDIRDIGHPELGDTYKTSLGELRAAKKSVESWEMFLAKNACNKYKIAPTVNCTGSVSIKARPFVIAIPTGSKPSYGQDFPINNTGEYAEASGYYYDGIPKYGYTFLASKYIYQTKTGKKSLPGNLSPSTYYWAYQPGINLPDSFVTNTCNVNSTINVPPADNNKFLPILYYPATNTLNPYFMRAFKLRTPVTHAVLIPRLLESDLYAITQGGQPAHLEYMTDVYNSFISSVGRDFYSEMICRKYAADVTQPLDRAGIEGLYQEKATRLYKKIKDLADNYYGKRFMVSIPTTYAAVEPESTKIRLSQSPTEAGYLDSSLWPTAYQSGIIPDISGINSLLTAEDKFYPFVKINDAITYSGQQPITVPYNYSEISPSERIFSNPHSSGAYTLLDMWIKCSVSDKIIFRDTTTLFAPRAIMELPGSISFQSVDYLARQGLATSINKYGMGPGGAFEQDANFTEDKKKKVLSSIGADEPNYAEGNYIKYPDLFAVPLRSNIHCYGPWYFITGSGQSLSNGPVEYEKNDDLAPWNYGGYTALNDAGFARVNDGITNQTFDETGSITVVGAPTLNIGDQLINNSGGPYITDIKISAGSDGINTTYSFQTWSSQRRLAKLNNFQTERIKRLNQQARDFSRAFREGYGNSLWKTPLDFFNDIRGKFVNLEEFPRRDKGTTSHSVIAAENDGFKTTVVLQPEYNTSTQASQNYENKAFMSLNGIFRAYSNWVDESGYLPGLTMPEDTGAVNTSLDLYPLRFSHGMSVLAGASGGQMTGAGISQFNEKVETNEYGVPNFKGIALANPLMLCGPGRDINDDPVPLLVDSSGQPILDSSGNKQWDYDAWYNPKKWKVGPLKTKWDEDNGVWVAGSSEKEGVRHIKFTIVSAVDGSLSVFGSYDEWDVGYTESDVPGDLNTLAGISPPLGVVEIFDSAGCYFDEPADELLGRNGYAHYLLPRDSYGEPRWVVTSLCCRRLTCAEGN